MVEMDQPPAGGARSANPLQLIKDALPQLRGGSARVARAILDGPDDAAAGSITRLAATADTAPATVTRLATQLGFDGFPALRAAIARETGRVAQAAWEADIGSAIAPDDPPERVLSVLASTEVNALRNASDRIDLDTVGRAADAIAGADRVHIYGEWGDAVPAEELAIRLLRIGVPVWFHEGQRASRVGAGLLGSGDVALVVSRSAEDSIAEDFLRLATDRGATTVAITGEPDAAVAKRADLVLFTGTRNGRIWTEFFAGRAGDVLTCGLLFVLVAQRLPDHLSNPRTDFDEPFPTHPTTGDEN